MANDRRRIHELLQQDLTELKLTQIADNYREVLDEAARKNTSMLEVLASLIAAEVTARRERALQRRMKRAKLPKRKTLEQYKFTFPKRIPKQKVLRLFDCEFISQYGCAVLIGPTGTGKSRLLTALGYTACEKGITVRFTRAIDMINTLTTAQVNGTLEKALKNYVHPSLLLLDELGYLPIDHQRLQPHAGNISSPTIPTPQQTTLCRTASHRALALSPHQNERQSGAESDGILAAAPNNHVQISFGENLSRPVNGS